jgi:hypothetical protein
MTNYLLSIYQPDGEPPPPEILGKVMKDLHVLNQELKSAGAWVFSRGLHGPDTATVVRLEGGDIVTSDGPYLEGKEHIGGFWVIEAPDDATAMAWADKATVACRGAVEVRPFQ